MDSNGPRVMSSTRNLLTTKGPSFAIRMLRGVMFSFPTRRLDLFYCSWPNVRRLFRRITRKGLLTPLAKRRPTPTLTPLSLTISQPSPSRRSLNLMLPSIAGNRASEKVLTNETAGLSNGRKYFEHCVPDLSLLSSISLKTGQMILKTKSILLFINSN